MHIYYHPIECLQIDAIQYQDDQDALHLKAEYARVVTMVQATMVAAHSSCAYATLMIDDH